MNNSLSDIVKVSIDLNTPVLDTASFSNILIVGPEPQCAQDFGKSGYEPVMAFTSLKAVEDVGIRTVSGSEGSADDVGIGAAAAFSQNPKPDKIYMAIRQRIGGVDGDTTYINITDSSTDSTKKVTVSVSSLLTSSVVEAKDSSGGNVEPISGTTYDYEIPDEENSYIIIDASGSLSEKNFGVKAKCYLVDDAVVIEKINTGDLESWGKTLNRALDTNGWYIVCPVGVNVEDYPEFVDWIDGQTKMGAFNIPYAGYLEEAGTWGNKIKASLRCFGIYNLEKKGQSLVDLADKNKAENVAWCVKCCNYYPGQETWALKTLNGILPSEVSSGDMQKMKEGKNGGGTYSYYTTYASKNITQGGMTFGGEWIDIIRGRDWLENEMQIRILSVLVKNPKIPYTDEGIALIHNVIIATLKYAQQRGVVAPDEYDSEGESVPGFVTYVPLAADISDSKKASRKLEDCSFAARIAGAIHVVEVKGSLTYSLN